MKGFLVTFIVVMLACVHGPAAAQAPTCNCPPPGSLTTVGVGVTNPGNPVVAPCCPYTKPEIACCCSGPPPKPEKCEFSIYMSRARVLEGQGFDGRLELQLTGYANGATVTHPSAATWFQLHKRWDWVSVNRLISTLTVEKGSQKLVAVMADAIEFDISFAGAPEIGSSGFSQLNLNCGQNSSIAVQIELRKIKNLVISQKGKVEVEFRAYEK